MIGGRARGLSETYRLARSAAARAGVTRLGDISGLGGLGLPVFQAVRPFARSLTVSQGKGTSRLAARVSALLEACELACAENLARPQTAAPLAALATMVQRVWSGERGPLTIDLDPALPRPWVEGSELATGAPLSMPWDLLSLDFTQAPLEYLANSDGLATGNSREEAVLAGLCELVEYHLVAEFELLTPLARRARQIDTISIPAGRLARELRSVEAAGFTARLWSLGQDCGIPAVLCKLFADEPALDRMTPTGGSACHPDPEEAALGALREAAQSRAALVAGARDDIVVEDYTEGPRRAVALALASLAVTDGALPWRSMTPLPCTNVSEAIAVLQHRIGALTKLPIAVFDHTPLVEGLHVVHLLAPGLRNLSRRKLARTEAHRGAGLATAHAPPARGRAVLFAGPSIAGLPIPPGVELRPPAVCGDLSALLRDPPAAVGLVDGCFGTAPTVWHKEILDLVAAGVRVLGGASIGALRAAELAEAGMEGVGVVYEAYRNGAVERDDAVMVLQANEEFAFAPLTLALVDAEAALLAAECAAAERRMMQRIARTMSYQTRSWARCLKEYHERTGSSFPLSLDALAQIPSLKRQDAALLIHELTQAAREARPATLCARPPLTSHYLRMLARTRPAAAPARE